MRNATVFDLPSYRVGPYDLQVHPGTPEMFCDKRRKSETDWSQGVVLLRHDLSPREGLRFFLRHLVAAIHYRSGLNDSSDEESFTHALASGLVEIALNNPEFWCAFQGLLEDHLKPGAGWIQAARGSISAKHNRRPQRIVCGTRTCHFEVMPAKVELTKRVYGYYSKDSAGREVIELSELLAGTNELLVTLHEVIHFLHACAGLKNKHSAHTFRDGQSCLFARLITQNPGFWRWWVASLAELQARRSLPRLEQAYATKSIAEKLQLAVS